MPNPMNIVSKPGEATKPTLKAKQYTITYEDLDDTNMQSGGYKLGFIGQAGTTKTLTSLCLGHLQKKNIPDMLEMGLVLTPKALEKNIIPEITKIIMGESEGTFRDQRTRPVEQMLLNGIPKIKYMKIPIVSKKTIIAAETSNITEESIQEIQVASDLFDVFVDDVAGKFNADTATFEGGIADRNTLVVVDSASRYKMMIDIKSDIDISIRLKEQSEPEKIKQITQSKWINRNMWWMRFMSVLRTIPSWTAVTFMIDTVPDWIIKMKMKKGETPDTEHAEIGSKTEFAFDNIYQMDGNANTKSITASEWFYRYAFRGKDAEKLNRIAMNLDGKFAKYSALLLVEHMLGSMQQMGVKF
jgi:hypothetical protein